MTGQADGTGRVPIVRSVQAAFAFLGGNWRAFLPVALIGAAALTPVQVWSHAAEAAPNIGAVLMAGLLGVLIQTPVMAACLRGALSNGQAPFQLQSGRDEANLLGATALLAFFFTIVVTVLFFILMLALAGLVAASGVDMQSMQDEKPEVAAAALMQALGPDGAAAMIALLVGGLIVLLWFSARLVLATPATVQEGRIRVFDTWGWTKGNAAPVAAALLLTMLVGIALAIPLAGVPSALAGLALGGETALRTPWSPAVWVTSAIGAIITTTVFVPLQSGLVAFLYRGLKPAT